MESKEERLFSQDEEAVSKKRQIPWSDTNLSLGEVDECPSVSIWDMVSQPPQLGSCAIINEASEPAIVVVKLRIRGEHRNRTEDGLHLDVKGAHEVLYLEREPDNPFDCNCIKLMLGRPELNDRRFPQFLVAWVAKEQAAHLAPLVDRGCEVIKLKISVRDDENFILLATCRCPNSVAAEMKIISEMAMEIKLSTNSSFPTSKPPGSSRKSTTFAAPSIPSVYPKAELAPRSSMLDATKSILSKCICDIPDQMDSMPELVSERLTSAWLSDHGFGGRDDKEWWGNRGLKCPAEWTVKRPSLNKLDNDPKRQKLTPSQKNREQAIEEMVVGHYGVLTEEMLDDLNHMFRTPIWCKHVASRGKQITETKEDQRIACFGQPYVLGQSEHDLKLVTPQHHNSLTHRLCEAMKILYECTFDEIPPSPGFNSIIFVLTCSASGFGYHKDQVSALKAKDFCMVPNQAVMTVVVYEKPDDSGKESLHFIPDESGTTNLWGQTYANPFRSLLSLETHHGMIHAQRKGLQEIAKHGVFPTPPASMERFKPRQGARIAITSRICPVDINIHQTMTQMISANKFSAIIDHRLPNALHTINWGSS